MKKLIVSAIAVLCIISSCGVRNTAQTNSHPELKYGWKLGSQAYTFNRFTFFEAVDKIKSCNLNYVEAFPGQELGGGMEGKMDYNMSAEKREQILAKLKEKGVKMVAFGIVGANNDADWRKLFEFAKGMGIENITSEPDEKDIPLLSKLCDEFEINIAIHDHPKPSHYWHPDVVLNAIKGQSKRVGACADIGHWVRSGLDPVECIKKLEGHIYGLHVKDLHEKGPQGHDVHWGTGFSNVEGVLRELKRQGFKGVLSAEYEYNWDNNAPDVAASVKNFREIVRKL